MHIEGLNHQGISLRCYASQYLVTVTQINVSLNLPLCREALNKDLVFPSERE